MLKGLYTATSAMITQQRRTEMLTNNIANANTPGYKEDQGSIRAFPEMLLSRIESDSFKAGRVHFNRRKSVQSIPEFICRNSSLYFHRDLKSQMSLQILH